MITCTFVIFQVRCVISCNAHRIPIFQRGLKDLSANTHRVRSQGYPREYQPVDFDDDSASKPLPIR